MAGEQAQQHPIRVYFWVWGWLFVLSVCSYLVDLSPLEGLPKWSLITLFMVLKAALIVAVFMHMVWERLSIVLAILTPAGVLLFLMSLLALESNYTLFSRLQFFFN